MIDDFDEHDAAMRWHRFGEGVEARVRAADAARSPEAITEYWEGVRRQEAKRAEWLRAWRRAGCPLTFQQWLAWKGLDDDDL